MPAENLKHYLNIAMPVILVTVSSYAVWDYTRIKSPAERVSIAYQRGEYEKALELAHPLLESKDDIGGITDAVIQSMLNLEKYLDLGELLCRERLKTSDTTLLNRVAMQLQTGNRRMLEVGVCCLERAVKLEPASLMLNYDLGLLCWNSGQVEKARRQCEKVLTFDPGNVQALQILERIAKGGHAAKLNQDKFQSRSVRFRMTVPTGIDPFLAGSWDPRSGRYVALGGWKPDAMIHRGNPGGQRVFELTKHLATDSVQWYQVVVRDGQDPMSPTRAFCRFPLYPTGETEMVIDLDDHPPFIPTGILESRPAPHVRAPPAAIGSRIYLLCVDSATFNILIPLVQAGLMENLRALMKRGTTITLISKPPVSTVAFDILNFGTLRGFGLKDVVEGGIGVLKERGVNLLTYGDIAGTDHTWKHLARQGFSTLYASWAEQLFYNSKGVESIQSLDLDPNEVPLAGRTPVTDQDKVFPLLWPGRQPAVPSGREELSHSDALVANLYDEGIKKFYQGLKLFDQLSPRVTLVHVGFIDVSFHMFWDSMDSEMLYLQDSGENTEDSETPTPEGSTKGEGGTRTESRKYERVIAGLHRVLDLMIGDLLSRIDLDHDVIILFSDHGAVGGFAKSYYGHVPEGILIVAGKGIRSNLILDGHADMVDLVPTICHLLGARPPEGYPGRVLDEILVQ